MNTTLNKNDLFSLAIQNIDENKLVEATCILEKIISIDNEFLPAFSQLGSLLAFQFGNLEEAETYLKKAYAQMKDDPFLIINLITVLRLLKKHGEAIIIIEKSLLVLDDDLSALYYELGLNREKQERFQSANLAFKNSIKYSDDRTDLNAVQDAIYRCELKEKVLL